MPCNPNIGGTAKGQLVREIDALGGEMGKAADRAMIQFRMLNASKGPAVLSPRAQIDRRQYQQDMKHTLEKQPNLDLRQGEAIMLLTENENGRPAICGVLLRAGAIYRCQSVILATGTFLEGKIIIGDCQYSGGLTASSPRMACRFAARARIAPDALQDRNATRIKRPVSTFRSWKNKTATRLSSLFI